MAINKWAISYLRQMVLFLFLIRPLKRCTPSRMSARTNPPTSSAFWACRILSLGEKSSLGWLRTRICSNLFPRTAQTKKTANRVEKLLLRLAVFRFGFQGLQVRMCGCGLFLFYDCFVSRRAMCMATTGKNFVPATRKAISLAHKLIEKKKQFVVKWTRMNRENENISQ